MAPTPPGGDSHQLLLDSLDIAPQAKPFRSATWKPSQRRNKNIKQITGEAARREASVLATTQSNSGTATPAAAPSTGAATPASADPAPAGANIAQAARNLSTLVLERNLQASLASSSAGGLGSGSLAAGGGGGTPGLLAAAGGGAGAGGGDGGPAATYTNIESAPSLSPARQRPYCDITGLPAPYTDPKTRLRYHNREVFGVVRTLPQGVAEQYLAARGAHVVLK